MFNNYGQTPSTPGINYNPIYPTEDMSRRDFKPFILTTGFFACSPYDYADMIYRKKLVEDSITLREAELLASTNISSSLEDIIAMKEALEKVIDVIKEDAKKIQAQYMSMGGWTTEPTTGSLVNYPTSMTTATTPASESTATIVSSVNDSSTGITVATDSVPISEPNIVQTPVDTNSNTNKTNEDDPYFGATSNEEYGNINDNVTKIFEEIHVAENEAKVNNLAARAAVSPSPTTTQNATNATSPSLPVQSIVDAVINNNKQ